MAKRRLFREGPHSARHPGRGPVHLPLTHLDDLDVFREWAPHVACFSFSLAAQEMYGASP